ncbi:cysteate racemase [Paenibacillus oceani]|uniref:Amino acid racemase n=1 Tax=Paenibacillus oceani TaxID=2772510 RepID=A0A927CFP8_9BACL|nr:amino acid racemase [Paenibacillus oceani]MBD2865371.1 amino acid racemase [Paenibacillus oceani]
MVNAEAGTKTIGVLGGMGPLATVDFFQKLVAGTCAASDQDHLHILINNNPKIPSRVQAICSGAPSPLPALVHSALVLQRAGADFLVMPCNTAHVWHEQIAKAIDIPLYSIIGSTVEAVTRDFADCAGATMLFATHATIASGLYQRAFALAEYPIRLPSEEEQGVVGNSIQGVKAGKLDNNEELPALHLIVQRHAASGIRLFIAGCTELPLLIPFLMADNRYEWFDPTLALAKLAIHKANAN